MRALRAGRDNEVVALSLGKNIARMRIQLFVLAGVLLGLTAPIYVWYIRAVIPDLFVINGLQLDEAASVIEVSAPLASTRTLSPATSRCGWARFVERSLRRSTSPSST